MNPAINRASNESAIKIFIGLEKNESQRCSRLNFLYPKLAALFALISIIKSSNSCIGGRISLSCCIIMIIFFIFPGFQYHVPD